jgi:hypothetical protein
VGVYKGVGLDLAGCADMAGVAGEGGEEVDGVE